MHTHSRVVAGQINGQKQAGRFTIDIVKEQEAQAELTQLRSGRGGRPSKYEPLCREIEPLGAGEALRVEVAKNEVNSLRTHLKRHFGETYVVRSAKKDDGETYVAFVTLNPEED